MPEVTADATFDETGGSHTMAAHATTAHNTAERTCREFLTIRTRSDYNEQAVTVCMGNVNPRPSESPY